MRLAAWNIEGRLGPVASRGRGTPGQIADRILQLDADIIFLPEAYGNDISPDVNQRFTDAGYSFFDVSYEDENKPHGAAIDNPHCRFLSRLPVIHQSRRRFGKVRSLQSIDVIDPKTKQPITIVGIHLDDRTEAQRLRQVRDVVSYCKNIEMPFVLMGDFNALYGTTKTAKFLRSSLVKVTGCAMTQSFVKTIVVRVAAMARGDTLDHLHENLSIHAANTTRQATATPKMRNMEWAPSVRLLEIDHILASRSVQFNDFRIGKEGGADHRDLTVTISL